VPPLDIKQFINKRLLFVGAHPDDIEGMAGGLIALLKQQNSSADIFYLIVTNGDKGYSKDYNMTSQQLAMTRQTESQNAAAVLGVPKEKLTMLNYPDLFLRNAHEDEVRQKVVAHLRKVQPFAVFTMSPRQNFHLYSWGTEHTDHHTTGQLVLDSIYPTIGCYLAYPNLLELGLPTWWVNNIYFFDPELSDSQSLYIDISPVIDAKINAFGAHQSQYNTTKQLTDFVQGLASFTAGKSGVSGLQYAEGYIFVEN